MDHRKKTRRRAQEPTRAAALSLLALALASGCWFGDDGDSDTLGDPTEATSEVTTGATTATTTGEATTATTTAPETSAGTTEPAAPCASPESCPELLCRAARCEAGACAYDPLPEGTIVDDVVGDCRRTQCDGDGGGEVIADDDPPEDTPGDCKKAACEAGEIVYVAADDDLPDDGMECTVDSCAAGEPTFTNKPKGTFCGPMGAHYCHDDGICRRCKQLDDPCDDPGPEPHESQELAYDLGKIGDADSAGGFLCGTVAGGVDVDWYVYEGDDTIFGAVDPTRVVDGKGQARLCVYAECLEGGTSVSCGDLEAATAPQGQKGCCGYGEVRPKLECGGFDDAAMIWIRVDQPQPECVPYDLDYHF
ncbi:MAG: hypothetical protein KC486_03175 [Myxococcales bacterium]|nr:hypothetical protein [Myxococcales bacterium]